MFIIEHLGNHSQRDRKESRIVAVVNGETELNAIITKEIPAAYQKENFEEGESDSNVTIVQVPRYNFARAYNFYHDDIWVVYEVPELPAKSGGCFCKDGLQPISYWRIQVD